MTHRPLTQCLSIATHGKDPVRIFAILTCEKYHAFLTIEAVMLNYMQPPQFWHWCQMIKCNMVTTFLLGLISSSRDVEVPLEKHSPRPQMIKVSSSCLRNSSVNSILLTTFVEWSWSSWLVSHIIFGLIIDTLPTSVQHTGDLHGLPYKASNGSISMLDW